MKAALDHEIRDFQSRAITMVRDFLLEELYHDADTEELANMWEVGQHEVRSVIEHEHPILAELLRLLHYSGLDFGIALRDPGSEKEITFFADNNLSGEPQPMMTTEEFPRYGSDKKGEEDGLDFLPIVSPMERTEVIDGDFTIIDEDEDPANPESTEYEELIARDLLEVFSRAGNQMELDDDEELERCENCTEHARIPDSMLCHHCTLAGVECHSPESAVDDDPALLMALVDHQAQHAKDHSLRLLQTAGLLSDDEES